MIFQKEGVGARGIICHEKYKPLSSTVAGSKYFNCRLRLFPPPSFGSTQLRLHEYSTQIEVKDGKNHIYITFALKLIGNKIYYFGYGADILISTVRLRLHNILGSSGSGAATLPRRKGQDNREERSM